MNDKKDFNPEKDIEFSIVQKLKKKMKQGASVIETEEALSQTNTGTNVTSQSTSPVMSNETLYKRGLFFDYFSTGFQEMLSNSRPPFSFVVVKDLSSLTQALKTSPQQVLFINWSINPKVYEQLLVQINAKFPSISIVVTGTDLTNERAKEIKSKFPFIKSFLMMPAGLDQLKKVLQIN